MVGDSVVSTSTTPSTVGTVANPLVPSHLDSAAFHAVTRALTGRAAA
ncbi:hypothetical protein KF840_19950 [bacterium]|nr:hypothetical protein [bacterium]